MTNTTECENCNGTGADPGGLNPFVAELCDWCGGTGRDPSVHEDEYHPCSECGDVLWAGLEFLLDRKPVQSTAARPKPAAREAA